MDTTRTFDEAAAEAQRRTVELSPVDRWSSLDKFEFLPTEGENKRAYLKPLEGMPLGLPPLQLSEHALRQLMGRVDYPVKLLDRLPAKLNHLSVNWLLQHYLAEREALIRTVRGNIARAVLGSRYTPLDDAELLTLATPYMEGALVRWEAFGELATHISVSWPTDSQDGLERGVHIANSEVGVRSVTIQAILYRPACANILPALGGGDGEDIYRRRSPFNRNRAQLGSMAGGWRFIHTGDKDRLAAFVKDAIEDTRRQYDALLARYRAGLEKEIDAIGAIEGLSKESDLTREQMKRTLEAFAQEYSPTVTGVANALTRAARYEEDPEERYHMQSLGTAALHVYLN